MVDTSKARRMGGYLVEIWTTQAPYGLSRQENSIAIPKHDPDHGANKVEVEDTINMRASIQK